MRCRAKSLLLVQCDTERYRAFIWNGPWGFQCNNSAECVRVCGGQEGESEGGWSSCLVIQFQSPVSPGCRWFETICEEDDCWSQSNPQGRRRKSCGMPGYVISAGNLFLIDRNVARHNKKLMMLSGRWHRPLIDWVLSTQAAYRHLSHAIAKSLIKSGEVEMRWKFSHRLSSRMSEPCCFITDCLITPSGVMAHIHTHTDLINKMYFQIFDQLGLHPRFRLQSSHHLKISHFLYITLASAEKLSQSTCTHPSFTQLMERHSVYWRQLCLLL